MSLKSQFLLVESSNHFVYSVYIRFHAAKIQMGAKIPPALHQDIMLRRRVFLLFIFASIFFLPATYINI